MQVILAKTAGFCYGVERAVHMAEAAAREGGCVMLGSIIQMTGSSQRWRRWARGRRTALSRCGRERR